MAVARRDALQRRDHEPEPACGIEVVGPSVQPVHKMVAKGLETATVAGQVPESPNGAVPVVVTRQLGRRIGQILAHRPPTLRSDRFVNVPKSTAELNDRRGRGTRVCRDNRVVLTAGG